MPVQLQAQSHIQCSGHPCIRGQRQQEEEEVHQLDHLTMEVEAAVKAMDIKAVSMADHRQEEELGQEEAPDQEEALDQEEADHLHHEEDMEEAAQRQAALHRSRQEEPVIQEALHLPLQVHRNLNVIQIHGVHSIDPGNRYQS